MNWIAMPMRSCSADHQVEDLRLDGDVERGGRLVGDQQRRLAGQRHGDHRPLPHAARKLVRVGGGALLRRVDADRLQQAHRLALALAPADAVAMQHQRLGDLPADRHHRVQRGHRLLEHHGDALRRAAAARRSADWPISSRPAKRMPALDPAGRGHQPHQRQRGDALAAAAFADHAERAAGRQRVGNAGHHAAQSALARKGHLQP